MSGSRSDRPVPGAPTNSELAERMASVETKQDVIVEKLDDVADSLDSDLAALQESHQEVKQRNLKLWYGYKLVKWGGGSAGLLAIAATLLL